MLKKNGFEALLTNNYGRTKSALENHTESWGVSSVAITAVSCPDKEYGFKVLAGADDWTFYKPTGPVTSIYFISNKYTVSWSDYDFNTEPCLYRTLPRVYGFTFFSRRVLLYSATAGYPLKVGMTMDIPAMVYNWNSRIYGSQSDDVVPASNASTFHLSITNVTSTHFSTVQHAVLITHPLQFCSNNGQKNYNWDSGPCAETSR
ncbi:MAG TPA: hypothetical protein VIJ75_09245 [Hanamia sp.]